MWSFITPELGVPDVVEAQRYYRDVLDFKITWTAEDGSFGAAVLGTTELFFAKRDAPSRGVVLCVRVPDVEAVHRRYSELGARVLGPVEEKPWAMREFAVEDPWGHRFRIGQSTEPGVKAAAE